MENHLFQLALDYIEHTNTPVFLTGKAGTGKTTFLKQVVNGNYKKTVVVAPTGVAAINAGGVTIHSMFGLPISSFVPNNDVVDPNVANNRRMLSNHFHYNSDKLNLLQNLELLIIDEVSMVRADLLDAVDFALRYVRNSEKPFGGIQVLMIGDLYQLPPVVKEQEWNLMSKYYKSEFFFDSEVFKKLDPVLIELKKIYRQSDGRFIDILNNIRQQQLTAADMQTLKEKYNPDFEPDEAGYITLSTHNYKADAINDRQLSRLPGDVISLEASMKGDFYDSMLPTDKVLKLKKGAQVMFVKNDSSGDRLYFNGKIGILEDVLDEDLLIRFPEEDKVIHVKKETWENVKFSMNAEENKIDKNVLGSFSQYPLRLAWAITIHKSQGLTFEKAVIDAGDSFAAGQVYVALSRCTSMDHLVLKSMIAPRSVISDPRIVAFSKNHMEEEALVEKLHKEKINFARTQLSQLFSFIDLEATVHQWETALVKRKSIDSPALRLMSRNVKQVLRELHEVGMKFSDQLAKIFNALPKGETGAELVKDRVQKAVDFFGNRYIAEVTGPFAEHLYDLKKLKKVKAHLIDTNTVYSLMKHKIESIYHCSFLGEKLYSGLVPDLKIDLSIKTTKKQPKGTTYLETLDMHRQGMSAADIAIARDMSVSTIEGHLAKWVKDGMIPLHELLAEDRILRIREVIQRLHPDSLTLVKNELGDDFSYNEIRYVTNAGIPEPQASAG